MLAAAGLPSLKNFVIFTLGVIVMRSAGCVINDYADRQFDAHVKRTQTRPLVTGRIAPREALVFFSVLLTVAFLLVLATDPLTIGLSVIGAALAIVYPFSKRVTQLPQLVLGAAFSWGIPMAYTAEAHQFHPVALILFAANLLWTVAYDTQYAMVDRDDDLKIGVKSTAILFGRADRLIVALLQLGALGLLGYVGWLCNLGALYFISLMVASVLFVHQHWLIRLRDRDGCFAAFKNNHYVGAVIFAGIALDLLL